MYCYSNQQAAGRSCVCVMSKFDIAALVFVNEKMKKAEAAFLQL